MAIGPETETYKGIEIRYGYDIVTDRYYARATLPNVITTGVPPGMRDSLKQNGPEVRYTLDAEDLDVLLGAMKEEIDERLDNRAPR